MWGTVRLSEASRGAMGTGPALGATGGSWQGRTGARFASALDGAVFWNLRVKREASAAEALSHSGWGACSCTPPWSSWGLAVLLTLFLSQIFQAVKEPLGALVLWALPTGVLVRLLMTRGGAVAESGWELILGHQGAWRPLPRWWLRWPFPGGESRGIIQS